MPEWMLPTLREFPVFGLVFETVWIVVKYLDRHTAARRPPGKIAGSASCWTTNAVRSPTKRTSSRSK